MSKVGIGHELFKKQTWERVLELGAKGWWKDSNKKFIYTGKIPEEYRLPLKLAIMEAVFAVVLMLLIAKRIFSLGVNIVLIVLLVLDISFPNIMVCILSRRERKETDL